MEDRPLTLAFSPCPNDTFMFYAWVCGRLCGAPVVRTVLADIDELNAMAICGTTDITKLSFGAFLRVRDRYALLHAGGALGRGCGPLFVARKDSSATSPEDFRDAPIAIPGDLTTAALLLRLRLPGAEKLVVMRFDQIMPAVAEGLVGAGVIIHEGRFTYHSYGLRCLEDLGDWWEKKTGLPIPLGGIVLRRDLPQELAARVDAALKASIEYARAHADEALAYARRHAQEMEDSVLREHINLYVNDFSLDYGDEGRRAIEMLLNNAQECDGVRADGAQPGQVRELFWDDARLGC